MEDSNLAKGLFNNSAPEYKSEDFTALGSQGLCAYIGRMGRFNVLVIFQFRGALHGIWPEGTMFKGIQFIG